MRTDRPTRWCPVALAAAALGLAPAARAGDFAHAVEADPATKWKVVVLRYTDPADPANNLEARIVPEAGSNLHSLKCGGTELLAQPPKFEEFKGRRWGTTVLFPTPARVQDGKFTFDGREYALPLATKTNALDEAVYDAAWSADAPRSDAAGASVRTFVEWDSDQPKFKHFPVPCRVGLRYTLTKTGVRVEYAVENKSDGRLPFGFGFNAYFNPKEVTARTVLHLPARAHMGAERPNPADRPFAPVKEGDKFDLGKPVSVEKLKTRVDELNEIYHGLSAADPPGVFLADKGIELTMPGSEEFTHALVWIGKGEAGRLRLGRMTCSRDAHNLHARGLKDEAHLLVAEKGATATGWVEFRVRRRPPAGK